MIKLKEPSKKETTPHYELVYNYMIGDANGDTEEEVELSKDNPHIERFVTLLNRLKPTKGTWGLILERTTIKKAFKEGQLTEDNYLFLMRLMFNYDYCEDPEEYDNEEDKKIAGYFKTEKENEYAGEFSDGIRGETEYSFLVFQGIVLYYYDEAGTRHETEIK